MRRDIFFTQFIDYYDRRGNYIKRLELSDLAVVEGDMWWAETSLIKRFVGGDANNIEHQTTVTVSSRSFDEGDVPERNFTHRFIERGRHRN